MAHYAEEARSQESVNSRPQDIPNEDSTPQKRSGDSDHHHIQKLTAKVNSEYLSPWGFGTHERGVKGQEGS